MPPIKNHAGAKPKHTKKTILRLLSYLMHYKVLWILVFFCVVLSVIADVTASYIFKPLINNYVIPLIGNKKPDLNLLLNFSLKMVSLFTLGAVGMWCNNKIMLKISTSTLYELRTQLFEKIQSLPIRFYDTRTNGSIMSLFTNDIDTLRDMMSMTIPQMLSSLLTVMGVFTMMCILNVFFALGILISVALILIVVRLFGKKSAQYFREQQACVSALNGYVEEIITGQRVVKVFNHEQKSEQAFENLNNNLYKAGSLANTFAFIMGPMMNNFSHIQYALVAMFGGLFTILGYMDVGTVAAFLQYTRSFAMPISMISQQFNSILNALAGAERIFDALDQEAEFDNGDIKITNATTTISSSSKDGKIHLVKSFAHTGSWAWEKRDGSLSKLKGEVRFNNVSFGYEKNKDVLHNISFTAKPGQKIALVGSTGSGKTTIINLLTRFYDIQDEKGSIEYDNIPIKQIRKEDLRHSLGIVLQDTHLFSGTIRENIRYGNLLASDSQVEKAAILANADTFINQLPEKYDTVLTGDASRLSQGQRQLLSIARAAVANPPILILDEATSSIDTRTETFIQNGMNHLMEGRTVLIIAHRLSTVRTADCILVLENGKIIEQGNHKQLLQQKGRYYTLYTGTFK